MLTILAIIIAIPVLAIVAWKMLGLIWALITDVAGLIFSIIVVLIVSLVVIAIL